MNKSRKSIITGAAVAYSLLGFGATAAESAEQPTLGGEPATALSEPVETPDVVTPAMAGPLVANSNPMKFDAGPLGPVFVSGTVSGLGLWQNNKFPDQQHLQASLSNGQVFIQKTDGVFQYFLDVGAYTFPALGAPYFSTATTTGDFFGPLPVAYAKIMPADNFYIQGGKLPGLVGVEAPFTFQNMNIERGLLWAQEPLISRGGQLGYTIGPMAVAVSWNDGFYSNRYTWLTGSATYTLDSANSFVLAAGGNYSQTAKVTTTTPFFQTTVTPLFQNNESIAALVYTYSSAPWTITPYFQYTHVPNAPSIGALSAASTYGGAILTNYSFGKESPLSGVSLPLRFEYLATTGELANGAPNLLYGPGSKAWSITFTPTYQYERYFARAEISHVGTSSTTPGLVFGPSGTNTTQTRGMIEIGVLF